MSEARMSAGNDFVVDRARELLWEGAFEDEIIERIMEGEYDKVLWERVKSLLTEEQPQDE